MVEKFAVHDKSDAVESIAHAVSPRVLSARKWRIFEPALCAALLCITYLTFDVGLRDSAKAGSVFLLGAYVLLNLPISVGLRTGFESFWRIVFALDLLVRSFLVSVYQTNPDAALVLDAIGNTSSGEAIEFIRHHAVDIAIHVGVIGQVAFLTLWLLRRRGAVTPHGLAGTVLALVFVGLHSNATARAANPLLHWQSQVSNYEHYQANLQSLVAKREATMEKLPEMAVTYTGESHNTIAVIFGESVNRNNWSLYGYPRRTSPKLDARSGELVVFKDVLAARPNTVGAFQHMLTPKDLHNDLNPDEAPSVILLAKAAGYKTFWISNQHDRYINSRFASEADVKVLLNPGGRRSDRSLDERVFPAWESAVNDPAPKKLIIVHLLGAHPHYEQRRPDEFEIFDGTSDAVTDQLRKAGRMPWIISHRNEYDNALLYHDHVVARFLQYFVQTHERSAGSFLYTSDHGQDVGHTRNQAGHAENLPGYEVPLFLWSSQKIEGAAKQILADRPYQNDVLDWTLLDLLDIDTAGGQPWNSLVSAVYQPPHRKPPSTK